MTTTFARPRPEPDPDSRAYWDACRKHRLIVQYCSNCKTPRFPPGPVCSVCGSTERFWKEASGRGRIFSWIVVRHPVPAEIFAAEVPYVVALIDLEEGVRLPSNVVGCSPENQGVAILRPMKVVIGSGSRQEIRTGFHRWPLLLPGKPHRLVRLPQCTSGHGR